MTRHATKLALLAVAGTAGFTRSQPVISLDDNPDAPLTALPVAGYLSAEHPFFVLGAGPTAIGPSPTLISPQGAYKDSDLFWNMILRFPDYEMSVPWAEAIDALSADHGRMYNNGVGEIRLRYSVDRMTRGLPGTLLEISAASNQQPGDIYQAHQYFGPPIGMVGSLTGPGPCAGVPAFAADYNSPGIRTMFIEFDERALGLTAGNGVGNLVSWGFLCPPAIQGSHDNVDAMNMYPARLDANGDGIEDVPTYFSVPPAYAVGLGVGPADILFTGPTGGPAVFATAAQCGLESMIPMGEGDDIDAMVVWSHVPNGVIDFSDLFAEPGVDYALFSLSPGSVTLNKLNALCALPVDGSTIFFTDFTGRFAIFCYGRELGIADSVIAGQSEHANVDALEIWMYVPPPCTGDTNGDGSLTPADFSAWIAAFNAMAPACDQNGDGLCTPADFSAWINNYNTGCG